MKPNSDLETQMLLSKRSDELADYEQFVDTNWMGHDQTYTMIALGGEAGEVLNTFKKGMRPPGDPRHDPNWEKKIQAEFGDVLYYLTRACHECGTTIAEVMRANRRKLEARKKSGTPGD